jgi:hypothetical protein
MTSALAAPFATIAWRMSHRSLHTDRDRQHHDLRLEHSSNGPPTEPHPLSRMSW